MFIKVTQREVNKDETYDTQYIININHIIAVSPVSLEEALSNGFCCEITMVRGVMMVIDSWESILNRIDNLCDKRIDPFRQEKINFNQIYSK